MDQDPGGGGTIEWDDVTAMTGGQISHASEGTRASECTSMQLAEELRSSSSVDHDHGHAAPGLHFKGHRLVM
jgi:hypothetical protein